MYHIRCTMLIIYRIQAKCTRLKGKQTNFITRLFISLTSNNITYRIRPQHLFVHVRQSVSPLATNTRHKVTIDICYVMIRYCIIRNGLQNLVNLFFHIWNRTTFAFLSYLYSHVTPIGEITHKHLAKHWPMPAPNSTGKRINKL